MTNLFEQHFNHLLHIRQNVLKITQSLSEEQLVTIPDNFNNNLLWNWGHMLVTQQLLCHKLANREMEIEHEFIQRYRKGTAPENTHHAQTDIQYLNENWLSIPEVTKSQIENTKDTSFTAYETSFGIKIHTIEEAVAFNNVHESLHLGVMMSLKKYV